MPRTQSAVKAARQSLVRKAQRQPVNSLMKTMMKKLADLVKAKKMDEALKILPQVYKAIDMASKRNLIHRRNADNKKSKMARMLAKK